MLAPLLLTSVLLTGCGSSSKQDDVSTTDSAETNATIVVETRSRDSSSVETRPSDGHLSLSHTTYIVEGGGESDALRLYLRNGTDSLEIIDHVDPSCGCILTTVQKTMARPGDSAMIYIALLTEQMSRTQPYTVDVYLVSRPRDPLRLTIWHREAYDKR